MDTTGVSPTAETSAAPPSSARERFEKMRQRDKADKPKPKPRSPSPTRSIEPGVFHYRAAEWLLALLQAQAAARGIELDMGDSVLAEDMPTVEDVDPQRLAKLTAHAVARVADRFSITRRFSRHLEGKERRAGILSDIGAALVCLYQRNPHAVEALAVNLKNEVQAAHTRRVQSQQQGPTGNGAGNPEHIPTPAGGTQ